MINSSANGMQTAFKNSRPNEDKLVYSISVSDKELVPRYDAGTESSFKIAGMFPNDARVKNTAPGGTILKAEY